MLLNLGLILIGIVLVLWGADRLTDGAVAVAQKLKVSQLVIGLTIVAMGTSMPEFSVSMVSALKGTSDLAVGNVVGSNIFNTLLIVGVAALVSPIVITKTTVRKDIPFALVASVVLMMLCYDGKIERIDAGIMFAMFFIFMAMTLQSAKVEKNVAQVDTQAIISETVSEKKAMPTRVIIPSIVNTTPARMTPMTLANVNFRKSFIECVVFNVNN